MSRAARALLNITALEENLHRVREFAPGKKVLAIVKANGYGHGMGWVAEALLNAPDPVDGFGVASLEEALLLRMKGVSAPVLLLEGFFHQRELADIENFRLDMVIHSAEQMEILKQSGFFKTQTQTKVWLKLDTGMHRLGFNEQEFNSAVAFMKSQTSCQFCLMSHLANADDPQDSISSQQIERFLRASEANEVPKSMANSAGIVAWPQSHMDIVRPGIMLYGANPLSSGTARELGLQAVMTLKSQLIAIKQLKKGDPIGYGGVYVCPQDMPVGVVAIGYGDGYPRHAPSGTPVLVAGQRTQLLGRVSMDMITVDLRPCTNAKTGDEVILWGEGLPVEEVAQQAQTISYELFCGVTARVEMTEV